MDYRPLADYPHFLQQIALWNLEEWPSYYDGALDRAIEYHANTLTRGTIPTCLVAVENSVLAGTVSLVMDDMDIRPKLSPWLASLYVAPQFRGRGVARQLIRTCMAEAISIEVSKLYVWTKELRRLFESLSWSQVESVTFLGAQVDVLVYPGIE